MSRKVKLSTCCMNQWALDFQGNLERIKKSISEARAHGSFIRLGSELEMCGYGCADHFLEMDTSLHCWEMLAELLKDSRSEWPDMIVVVGMPVFFKSTNYNCAISVLNGKILLIRPKLIMCNDENYRESRWFVGWQKRRTVDQFLLPEFIAVLYGQKTCPFGDAMLQTNDDVLIGFEICEELWTSTCSHVDLALNGADLILNCSASHHMLRKSNQLLNRLVTAATEKHGGIYLFANQRGCDGDRLYYDGNATIAQNGKIYAQGYQFAIQEVEVVSAVLDVNANAVYRNRTRSSRNEAARAPSYPLVSVDLTACVTESVSFSTRLSTEMDLRLPTAVQEIAHGPPAWLWDYLRRSKQGGFFLPLSGGRDSAAVAAMVHSMCRMVADALKRGDGQVTSDVERLFGTEFLEDWRILTPERLCNQLLFTCYMGTQNSSAETKQRAADLAQQIGSNHSSLRGYLTKYDCSSADINPIGSISKKDLDSFLQYCVGEHQLTSLKPILVAPPTAELEPLKEGGQLAQTDEADMGMTYAELSEFGQLRRPAHCGPYYMFLRLVDKWHDKHTPIEVAAKVKHFFRCYAINRHKATVLTPAYHAEAYSPDDHRYDHRPFLYNVQWPWQFARIDRAVSLVDNDNGGDNDGGNKNGD